ncbi:hypothetical protein [Gymnodinialimonas sp.]
MIKLPNLHRRIGAALLAFMGLFFGLMAWVEAPFILRPHGERYAVAGTMDWMIDTLSPSGAALAFAVLGVLAAVVFWRLTVSSD